MIHVEAIWLATEPLDMRAGAGTALARVVAVFGAARPHHAYCFANRRANRMKVLIHDGIGVWLAARRLNEASSSGPMRCTGRYRAGCRAVARSGAGPAVAAFGFGGRHLGAVNQARRQYHRKTDGGILLSMDSAISLDQLDEQQLRTLVQQLMGEVGARDGQIATRDQVIHTKLGIPVDRDHRFRHRDHSVRYRDQ
jgi:hypothetical protein